MRYMHVQLPLGSVLWVITHVESSALDSPPYTSTAANIHQIKEYRFHGIIKYLVECLCFKRGVELQTNHMYTIDSMHTLLSGIKLVSKHGTNIWLSTITFLWLNFPHILRLSLPVDYFFSFRLFVLFAWLDSFLFWAYFCTACFIDFRLYKNRNDKPWQADWAR